MGSDFYLSSILPHAGIIIKLCRAYTNNKEDFDDYYQEVCLQIWRSRNSYKHQCQWSTWVYKITLNVCLTYLKKSKRKVETFVSDPLPETAMENNEQLSPSLINQLYDAIKLLSEIDRGVILLYLEEKTYQEIAEITGANTNSIGVRINRIKSRLNKHLQIEAS